MAIFLPNPDLYLVASVVASAIFLYFIFNIFRSSSSNPKPPPEAPGGWPILGHLHLLWKTQEPHVTLGALAEKYGPVFSLRLGMNRAVVVSSWEAAKECFTTNDAVVASRPKLIGGEHLGYNYSQFGSAEYGPYWRSMRKLTALELLSMRRLEMLSHVRTSEVGSSVKELFEIWSKNCNRDGVNGDDSGSKVLVDMDEWLGRLNLNVILRMVVGKRFYGGGDERDEEEARRCQKAFKEFFRLFGIFMIGDSIPFLRWLDLGGQEKAMKRAEREMDQIVSEWLEEKKKLRKKDNNGDDDDDNKDDLMDVMISTLQDSDLHGFDADTVTKSTCLTVMTGATDTITVTIIWLLSLLLNNPHVLKRVQEELDSHIGKERIVSESDLPNLVYLQAVIKEAFRLYPVGPLGGIREISQDCIIQGYKIRAGTRLLVNVWKIQRDPRVWPDPERFDPDRFLTTHKNLDVKGQHFELIPFGAGRRICPGVNLGLQMTQLVLATLLHVFEVSAPDDEPIDMSGSFGLSYSKATPLKVLVVPRLPHHLYN